MRSVQLALAWLQGHGVIAIPQHLLGSTLVNGSEDNFANGWRASSISVSAFMDIHVNEPVLGPQLNLWLSMLGPYCGFTICDCGTRVLMHG